MKHLKLFENHKDLYKEINLLEWQDYCKGEFDNFTNWETEQLMQLNGKPVPKLLFQLRPHLKADLKKQYYFVVDVNRYGFNLFYSLNPNPSEVDYVDRFIHVLKMDDGWFVVDMIMYENRLSTHFFYRCDQWDGLMKLMKDFHLI